MRVERFSEPQREVKRILEDMTGLGVRIVPFTAPVGGGIATVSYMFKLEHSDPYAGADAKAQEVHQFNDYIKTLLMKAGRAGHDQISLALTADPEDPGNGMYPCVVVRFSNVMGEPFSERGALETARELQRNLKDFVQRNIRPAQLKYYQQLLRDSSTFKDGYAKELGV
jgi:hypothetical protein